jgi:transposase
MFLGSELAGQWAAIVMSLVQAARMNGHYPWIHLRGVRRRLPMPRNVGSRSCWRIGGNQLRV